MRVLYLALAISLSTSQFNPVLLHGFKRWWNGKIKNIGMFEMLILLFT